MRPMQFLMLLLFLAFGAQVHGQLTVEDYKSESTGFDLTWAAPATTAGSGATTYVSNGEIGKLSNDGPESVVVGVVQFNEPLAWNPATQRYAQIMVPNLTFGNRLVASVYSDANGFAGALLHDQYLAVPGQGPRPQTFDINAALPNQNPQNILIRFTLVNEGYGTPGNVHANIDWLKVGLPNNTAPGIPGFVGPTDGQATSNPPTLTWSAPAGFTNNKYTVTYSKDPLFSDPSTVTVLDTVTGTSFTPSSPLAAGTWYWTVSATSADRVSGEVLEKALAAGGDARNPADHRFYSFTVNDPPPLQITVEDFKNQASGFDLIWAAPATVTGTGLTTFISNNEIGKLSNNGSETSVVGVVQFNEPLAWNPAVQRYAQVMVPNLTFGNRLVASVFSDANGFAGALLHDQFTAVPGQGPRPQTFDINAALPNQNPQNILIRFTIVNEGFGTPGNVHANIDWFKLGMPADAPADVPGFVGPSDGQATSNPPTMSWSAPANYTHNTYTVTYSQDPLFSDASTVTVLDAVNGTSFTPSAPLAAGTWYWTVSATNSERISGLFLEKPLLVGGDARDPAAHQFYSFTVTTPVVSAAEHWTMLD